MKRADHRFAARIPELHPAMGPGGSAQRECRRVGEQEAAQGMSEGMTYVQYRR
jgi:hypothetical protein